MNHLKKFLSLVLTVLLLVSAIAPVMAEDYLVKVFVEGKRVHFDVQPKLINSRTMVPLRAIFEALDTKVEWDDESQTVTSTKDDTTVKLTIGDAAMYVNDKEVTLDSPACLVDDRTLVPVRAISEAFEMYVRWDEETFTVIINEPRRVSTKGDDVAKVEKDENGNVTYIEYTDKTWKKFEYNEYGYRTYIEEPDGYWEKYTYDVYGNETYIETADESWYKYAYDENGCIIKYENSAGYWCDYTNDEVGNETYRIDSDGYWEKSTYDEKGNKTYVETSDNEWIKYTYDENGNMVYAEYSNETWDKYTYDENGNITYVEESTGKWYKYEYNENGDLIYIEDYEGYWEKYTYGEDGSITGIETSTDETEEKSSEE